MIIKHAVFSTVVAAMLLSGSSLFAGKEEPMPRMNVTEEGEFNRDLSELWTAVPEKISFRRCNETQRIYIFACCRKRWLATPDGRVFDRRDRDMASLFHSRVAFTEALGKGYYRALVRVNGRDTTVAISGVDRDQFKRDESGRFFVENVILRGTEEVYSYTNAAGQEIKFPVFQATHTTAVSKAQFAKHLRTLELGVNAEVPVVKICEKCNGRGSFPSRINLGEKIKCDACEGIGYHVTYHLAPVTW